MVIVDEEIKKNMCFKKKIYFTEKYARKVASSIEDKRCIKLRVYQCPVCGFFHLTHVGSSDNYANI